jgi:glycosyltransferase involved in cell wall biosynthesis
MWQMSVGGAERAVYQLVREQRRRGVVSDVAVARNLGLYGERATVDAGATVFDLRCHGALDVRHSLGLAGIAKKYAIVHHHGIEPLLLAASARARLPRIVYTHRGGLRTHGPRKRLKLTLAVPFLRRCSAVSANTSQSARVLAQLLGISEDDVPVVYNGLDFDLLTPSKPRDVVAAELPASAHGKLIVGTASRLQDLKRVDRLLDAVAECPEIHCLILGDGPARKALEARARSRQLGERVTFLGRRDHVGNYLQLMDIFVLPSGPQEAFGNAAVEAMGLGIPTVVFSDGGGLTEHIRDGVTGRVVDDVTALTDAIAELAQNQSLRRALGHRGREHVRFTYSIDRMFQGYAALYDGVLAGNHHSLSRAN